MRNYCFALIFFRKRGYIDSKKCRRYNGCGLKIKFQTVKNMTELIKEICALVRECGKVMLSADREKMAIDIKSGVTDLVTEYDTKIQEMLFLGLKKIVPDAKFIGEEGSADTLTSEGEFFIVDPIDGTTNFIKDYHHSAISVAFLKNGVVEAGVIYNPYLDEMFYAIKGYGAFCNDKKIKVSDRDLKDGVVLFGTSPYKRELSKKTFEIASEYFSQCLDIRRSGSAALDLCWVAAGRAELYFELELSPWDYAAGKLIVEEAGGVVTAMDGEILYYDKKSSIVARNK